MRYAIVELHDVCPYYYDEFCACLDLLNSVGIKKYSLLVVPNFHNQFPLYKNVHFVKVLRSLNQEIILHGYTHKAPVSLRHILHTYGEGEFGAAELVQTYEALTRAMDIMQACGLEVQTFVPPAWISNPYLEDILYAFGFLGLGYRDFIKNLETNQSIPSKSITFSNRFGLSYLSIKALPLLYRLFYKEDLLRLALHMKDMRDKRKIALWRVLLSKLKKDRRLTSYGEVLGKGGFTPAFKGVQPAGWLGNPAFGMS